MQHEKRGVQVAACDMADTPRAIRRHQWSALNVPLMWAAAAGDRSHPVFQWLLEVVATIPEVTVAGIDMTVQSRIGWEALRDILHSRGIGPHEDLVEWIHAQGFPMPGWGAQFQRQGQERILDQPIAVDARVSGLESLFVRLTMAECQRRQHPQSEQQEPFSQNQHIEEATVARIIS